MGWCSRRSRPVSCEFRDRDKSARVPLGHHQECITPQNPRMSCIPRAGEISGARRRCPGSATNSGRQQKFRRHALQSGGYAYLTSAAQRNCREPVGASCPLRCEGSWKGSGEKRGDSKCTCTGLRWRSSLVQSCMAISGRGWRPCEPEGNRQWRLRQGFLLPEPWRTHSLQSVVWKYVQDLEAIGLIGLGYLGLGLSSCSLKAR